MPRLLFVCTGNTCRSPLAAMLAQRIAAREGMDLEVASAGISAVDGAAASGHAQFVAHDLGSDLSGHRSRRLDADLVRGADLVLCLTSGHRDAIRREWPERSERVLTLAEIAGSGGDVEDPFGGDLEAYERTARQIEELLETGWAQIARRLAA
jgi:protein-tyrosine-phosphatase